MYRSFAFTLLAFIVSPSLSVFALIDPHLVQGQKLIDQGKYQQAIDVFTNYFQQNPTNVEGYRGRIEASVMLHLNSNAVRDYAKVTAVVIPVFPNAPQAIFHHCAVRLQMKPNDKHALTGASFAHWWYFDYPEALNLLHVLLQKYPNDPCGILFLGSSRALSGLQHRQGFSDLMHGIQLDRNNPHLRFIVADAYTYGLQNYRQAFNQAQLAIAGGLDTPRLRAIFATCYDFFGKELLAAQETMTHFSMVVTNHVSSPDLLFPGDTAGFSLVPGVAVVIPIPARAGDQISITTEDPTGQIWDTIVVMLAPDGTPVKSADDVIDYYAAFDWTAPADGVYQLMVTSFESVGTGEEVITRF